MKFQVLFHAGLMTSLRLAYLTISSQRNKLKMNVSGSEGTNETKKPGGKKAGKADPPTTAKSQDKKGEKKVGYYVIYHISFKRFFQLVITELCLKLKVSKEQGILKEGVSVDISALRCILLSVSFRCLDPTNKTGFSFP